VTALLVVVAGLVAAAALWRIQLVHIRRVRRERQQLLDGVQHVLDGARVRRDGLGYPLLTGSYRGHPVRIELLVDTLALRKLPVLWLVVTQQRQLALGSPVDVLARPSGTEFFSPNAAFVHELAPPEGFPAHVRAASPGPDPAEATLERLAPLVCDERTKEVLATNAGVRVVRLLAEGAQGPYRSTRRADFGAVRIVPEGLCRLLDTVTDVGDALAGERVGSD
jgi:hypothetical protein